MVTRNERIINQIESIIGSSIYNSVIYEQLEFFKSNFKKTVPITLIDNPNALLEEHIYKTAKVVWEEPNNFPRKPQSIMIDIININGLNFLFTFLHECGHIKDYNNRNILLNTKRSEVSAWKHAYFAISSIPNFSEIRDTFFNYLKNILHTYKVDLNDIEEFIHIDLMTIH